MTQSTVKHQVIPSIHFQHGILASRTQHGSVSMSLPSNVTFTTARINSKVQHYSL